MAFQNFLIAPLKSGIQTNRKPWLIADDAYQLLRNVYTWRGRVKKRWGARVLDQAHPVELQQQFTRLRINVGTTNNIGGAVGFAGNGTVRGIGQMFSIGNDYYTVDTLGTPSLLLSTNALAAGTYNTTTGAYSFVGATPLTTIYFYPATPVMHFGLYQQVNIDNEITIAFDQNYSYQYTQGIGWQRSGTVSQGLWSGSNSDFHWTTNWRGVLSSTYYMFVVNNIAADGIQYFGIVAGVPTWFVLAPPVTNNAGDTILTALIVEVFKGYMFLFNVLENVNNVPTRFANRIRISQFGSPIDVNAWNVDTGQGNFINAPTNESIISVQPLKDRMIVFFESSTYELVYTNNNVAPFVLQKINTELGVESTHSTIPFDKVVLGMGSTGAHACNGLNVQRIDDDIPNTIFDINNLNNGPLRVHGIRDYFEELAYWTYPSDSSAYRDSNVFPNKLLILDYINGTWANFDDSITTFGYFYLQNNYLVWQNIQQAWNQMDLPWNYGIGYNLFRSVIAGNQEGWTFVVTPDLSTNSMSLQITNIVAGANVVTMTVINHNITPTSPWIYINNIQSVGGNFTTLNGTIQSAVYVDENTIQVPLIGAADTYTGGGTLELVSTLEIYTKQYNFFSESARRCFIAYTDFYVDRTATGSIIVEYLSSTSLLPIAEQAFISDSLLGTNILETSPYILKPYEASQAQFWHRIYFQQDGENIQLHLYNSVSQMMDGTARNNGFVLNAMIFYAQPTAPIMF